MKKMDHWSRTVNFFSYSCIGDREVKGSLVASCDISTNLKLKKTLLSAKRNRLNIK